MNQELQLHRALVTSYPTGRQGAGLFFLRAALGIGSIVQGTLWLGDSRVAPVWLGFMALVVGGLLTIGLLTPIATTLVVLSSAGLASLFDSKLSVLFAAAIAIGIFLLGPGAHSVDARLFGRREILIPLCNPEK